MQKKTTKNTKNTYKVFTTEDLIKYRAQVTKARLTASTIPEFFDMYTKTLKDVFDVTMEFTDYPDQIIDKRSSYNSPIGKPQAWSTKQQANPNIPNYYKAYAGQIVGHLVKNDGEYADSNFEGYDLFWTFSDISLNFVNGTPNGGIGRGERFNVSLLMFLEDFPVMYRKYRKAEKIDQANEALSNTIDQYKKQVSVIHHKMVEEDPVIDSIEEQLKDLEEIRRTLLTQKVDQINALKTKAIKSGLPLPKIENPYLNLNVYNKLRIESEAPVEMVQDQDLNDIYKKVEEVVKTFKDYSDDFAEDFL